ncbi:putative baseplate assembly protein [Paraburkholderia sp. J7]|uniref:putative baseplate assembly protein n=1 Tax=Paraburkholderia sp. J7 TaxID=2805438 RepID=UPI002AB76560|nr:putative baseplate assembly protein [Paraburkholderia sp. J7]
MNGAAAGCDLERRREDVRRSALYGIDFVEVGASQTTLDVHFLGKAPADLNATNLRIEGGAPVSISAIRLNREPDPAFDDWLEIDVGRPGDWSTYTLAVVNPEDGSRMTGFDPCFACVTFSFKASCPSDLDCCATPVCPPPARPAPDIDYLAKDYDSFRRLILDRLALTMPAWQETHVPDIGVMLVELLAYAGDQLSYYQDAVATEAYLNTARQRISLRRHARLVDYAMHEGCNARAWVSIAVTHDMPLDLSGVAFCTGFPGAPQTRVLQLAQLASVPAQSFEWFEPLWPDRSQTLGLREACNEIAFYTWGDCACCLPAGATRATLLDHWVQADSARARALNLKAGDVLIFEEVIGPRTGNAADADPTHRQAVRLTRVTPAVDPLYEPETGGRPVVEIEWCTQDALGFALCLSAVMPAPDCTCRDGLSVARGNVLLVDHGAHVGQTLGPVPQAPGSVTCASECGPPRVVRVPVRFAPSLDGAPLTFTEPLNGACCAVDLIAQDPRGALPYVWLASAADVRDGSAPLALIWTSAADLLDCGPDDRRFVVEIDDIGTAHLRFGDGTEGRAPDAGTTFEAGYRIGNGPAGNVGAESIRYLVYTQKPGDDGLAPRNPLPATGGTAPETAAEVRMFAPHAFRSKLERAITADDYATLADDNARRLAERAAALCGTPFTSVQGAQATLCWNGSWYEARVALDPFGSETVDAALTAQMGAYLTPYRRIGHDLRIVRADNVPLDLGLSVCVQPGYQRAHVKAALLAVFGTGTLPGGRLAMFNPDNQTFGQRVFVSQIVAAAQAVSGVIEAEVTRLRAFVPGTNAPSATPDDVPASGMLALGASQIARLDNDPDAPGQGRLTVLVRGGL